MKSRTPKELTLILDETSINTAVEDYVNAMGINTDSSNVTISLTVGRGVNPTSATVTLSQLDQPKELAPEPEEEPKAETVDEPLPEQTTGNKKGAAKKPKVVEPKPEVAKEEEAEEVQAETPEPEEKEKAEAPTKKRTAGSLFD